jgi:hypothetical protein
MDSKPIGVEKQSNGNCSSKHSRNVPEVNFANGDEIGEKCIMLELSECLLAMEREY